MIDGGAVFECAGQKHVCLHGTFEGQEERGDGAQPHELVSIDEYLPNGHGSERAPA